MADEASPQQPANSAAANKEQAKDGDQNEAAKNAEADKKKEEEKANE